MTEIQSKRDYEKAVNRIVDTVEDYLRDDMEGPPDPETADQVAFEEVDHLLASSTTDELHRICLHADRDPEEFIHLIGEPADYRDVLVAMAYDILRAEVGERLDRREVFRDG